MGIKLVVMASGRGSNFVAICEAIAAGKIPHTEIAALVTHKPEAPVIAQARQAGVRVEVISDKNVPKVEYEQKLLALLQTLAPDYIVLAGYMKLLGKELVQAFAYRILNIHPSLLPAFKGLKPQQQAIDAGVKSSGCTVHVVTEEMDAGPILGQASCPVEPGDTAESLAARILPLEHALYVKVLSALAQGTLKTR